MNRVHMFLLFLIDMDDFNQSYAFKGAWGTYKWNNVREYM